MSPALVIIPYFVWMIEFLALTGAQGVKMYVHPCDILQKKKRFFTLAECDWRRTCPVDWGIEEHLPFAPCNANFTHLTNFYPFFQPTLFVGIPEVIGGDQRKPIPIAIKKLQNRTIVCVECCNVSPGFDLPPVVSQVL